MKKKFILVSSLFFSMSINEVFSGNLCCTNGIYNSSSISAQNTCIMPQNASNYNEENEFEIPIISTKCLEWKALNISELKNRAREYVKILDKIEKENDFKSTIIEQMQILAGKIKSDIALISSKLSQGTSYCVSKVKDFAVSIYQNMKSFITNSVISLKQKIN